MRLHKPKITYRQFCLIQNSWMDLWTNDNEKEVIASMHPKTSSKLERVEILENGKEERTLIWTNEKGEKLMDIEVRRITVNCGNVEVKDLKELDSLYSEGVIDEIVYDYIWKIKYEYYLNGKKIKADEC